MLSALSATMLKGPIKTLEEPDGQRSHKDDGKRFAQEVLGFLPHVEEHTWAEGIR